ncbi:MAG: alanine--tRNA ligase [Patescibacteria group bacterium]
MLESLIMDSAQIRERFLKFFEVRGHKIVPSSSLVPENDPSVLFTTAGMQPLIPYLLGTPHPAGKRLVNIQKCVRTQDIEEVGDSTHDTFFEMLGNWSLGDYFKKEAIEWSWQLLIDKTEGFGLDPARLYVTCFEGNTDAPRDEESAEIWKSLGVPANHIYFLPAKNNWWSAGPNGPCGPDTEMFYDLASEPQNLKTKEAYLIADEKQTVVEIWNDVFMEYEQRDGKVIGKLKQKNVDTGSGLERLTMALQGKNNIFETDLFSNIIETINQLATKDDLKAKRIVADHIRTAVFIITDGVTPSNTGRGYILRRLIRRAVRYADKLEMKPGSLVNVAAAVVCKYAKVYPEVDKHLMVEKEIGQEEQKFRETLERGLKEFEKGIDPFILFTSYGFPLELIKELAQEKGQLVDENDFQKKMADHQSLSRTGAEQKFAGGLADHEPATIKLHTAHHLLLAALKQVLGPEVKQKGSNITQERLRLDFSWPEKMTEEQKKRVEEIVNQKIGENLPVKRQEMAKSEAEKLGAEMEFGAKYGDAVSVYFIGDPDAGSGQAFSKEFCGGPHVANTSELGTFKILKEEAVAAGVRRIKAVLTNPPTLC